MAQHVERRASAARRRSRSSGAQRERTALHVAMHLRRLAEQHVHRHVDHASPAAPSSTTSAAALLGRDADHRERAALALADRVEERQRVGRDREHVALLALVAPDFLRRQAALLERHLAQVEARAAAGAVDEFGERVREAARADVVDRQDRVLLAERCQQWLMTSCARRWISGLPRCTESKSSSAAFAPVAIELAAPPPMPMRMPGPPSWISSVPAGKSILCVKRRGDRAEAAGDHDRLVIAAPLAADVLLVDAEVAAQVRPAEFVVERGAAERAVDHDLQRARDVAGLAVALALPRLARSRAGAGSTR